MEFKSEYYFLMTWIAATFFSNDKIKAVEFLAHQCEESKQGVMRLLREEYTVEDLPDGRVFIPELA